MGLSLALIARLALLASIAWIINAHQPCRAGRRGVVRMAVFVHVAMPMHVRGAIRMGVAVLVPMLVLMPVAMIVVMPVVKIVVMAVIVRVAISLLMRMAVIGFGTCVQVRHLMRMIVRLEVVQVLDLLLALTATADTAHHTTSISFSRISSPPWASSFTPPQLGHDAP